MFENLLNVHIDLLTENLGASAELSKDSVNLRSVFSSESSVSHKLEHALSFNSLSAFLSHHSTEVISGVLNSEGLVSGVNSNFTESLLGLVVEFLSHV